MSAAKTAKVVVPPSVKIGAKKQADSFFPQSLLVTASSLLILLASLNTQAQESSPANTNAQPLVPAQSLPATPPQEDSADAEVPSADASDASDESEMLVVDDDDMILLGGEDLKLTGTRISQVELEKSEPFIVITQADIKEQGFTNIYDALNSITLATGQTIGEQFSDDFTPISLGRISAVLEPGQFTAQFTTNAKEINLRGFGPSRTLVLVNGRRVTHSPIPFDGFDNFFDFSQIPLVAVDRIEVVTGGSSAIYGSDAVAGVVNIILASGKENSSVSVRGGTTTQGGGESFSVSGHTSEIGDNYNWLLAFQHDSNGAIYGNQRSWMDNVNDNPLDIDPIRRVSQTDAIFGRSVRPPDGACARLGFEVLQTTNQSYCAESNLGRESIRNERTVNALYSYLGMQLEDKQRFFAEALFTHSSASARQDLLDTGDVLFLNSAFFARRTFTEEETGNQDVDFDDRFLYFATGVSGELASVNYRVAFTGSFSDHVERQLQLDTNATFNFLGSDPAQIWEFTTPQEAAAITGTSQVNGDTYLVGINSEFTFFLGEWNDTPVWLSTVLEYSTEGYDLDADERSLNGGLAQFSNIDSWLGFFSTRGNGQRDRGALGFETKLPVMDHETFGVFDVQIAGRYDFYNDKAANDSELKSAPTFKLGMIWRPTDSMLLRGTYTSNFRAPSMHFVFSEPFPETGAVFDEFTCRDRLGEIGSDFNVNRDCGPFTAPSVSYTSGSTSLSEEQGNSASLGLVFNPLPDLYMSIDAYRITLKNIIDRQQSVQDVLEIEANCLLGEDRAGNPVDINSQACQDVFELVTRQTISNQEFILVESMPVSTSLLEQRGVDASIIYNFSTPVFGDVDFKLYYSYIDSFDQQVTAADALQDIRNGDKFNNLRSKFKGVVSWYYENLDSSLTVQRLGSTQDLAREGRVNPWTVLNFNFGLKLKNDAKVSFTVNNLLDELPPYDPNFDFWPFYNRGQYSGVGRELFLEYSHQF